MFTALALAMIVGTGESAPPYLREIYLETRPGARITLPAGATWGSRTESTGRTVVVLAPSLRTADALEALRRQPGVTRARALVPRLKDHTSERGPALVRARAAFREAAAEYAKLPAESRVTTKLKRGLKKPAGLGYVTGFNEWYSARTYPHGRYDQRLIEAGLRQKAALDITNPAPKTPWVSIGPTNLQAWGTDGFGPAPLNGRINGAAFDPFNGQRAFLASALGGVWVTGNAGNTWNPLSDSWQENATSCVVVNPSLQHRVYVGTGDQPGGRGSGIGVFVSTNGGSTWSQRGLTQLRDSRVNDIIVDPDQPQTLIVAVGGGEDPSDPLWRTPDEGLTWDSVVPDNTYWTDLDVGIKNGNTRYLYAAGHRGVDRVLVRSNDHGVTWQPMTLPAGSDLDRIYIAASKVDFDKVYIVFTDSRRVWHNGGRGGAWVEITDNLPEATEEIWGQSNYNTGLTCFRRVQQAGDGDGLLLHNIDLTMSLDADGDWQSAGLGYTGNDLTHVDHHFAVQHPNDPNQIMVCNDGGAYILHLNHATGAVSFTPLNRRLGCTLISRIALHPTVENSMIAGAQDNGFPVCGGDTLNWGNLYGGDGGHAAINQTSPLISYIVPPGLGKEPNGDGFLLRTADGWQTRAAVPFNTFGEKHRSSPPIAIDATNPRYVYVATDYLHRYDEMTATWSLRLGNKRLATDEDASVRHFAIAPTDGQRIYTVSLDGEIWMTSNGGANWTQIDAGLPGGSYGHISVNPSNKNSVLVGCETLDDSPRLWECTDVTANPPVWVAREGVGTKKLPRVPVNAIARHPSTPSSRYFVATDLGVFYTADGGTTWTDFTPAPFPASAVWDLKIQASRDMIYAATWGRGVWKRRLPQLGGFKLP